MAWIPPSFTQMPRWSQAFAYLLALLGVVHFTLTGQNKKSRGLASVAASAYFTFSGRDVTRPEDYISLPRAFLASPGGKGYLALQQERLGLQPLPFREGPRPDTVKQLCHWQRDQQPSYEFSLAVRYEVFGPTSALMRLRGVTVGDSTWELPPSDAFFFTASDEKKPQEFAFLQHIERYSSSWIYCFLHAFFLIFFSNYLFLKKKKD
ncbi:MAG: hypothetical protein Q8P67_03375 [archaeon]|nr:hypothetical protein [archaeon]